MCGNSIADDIHAYVHSKDNELAPGEWLAARKGNAFIAVYCSHSVSIERSLDRDTELQRRVLRSDSVRQLEPNEEM